MIDKLRRMAMAGAPRTSKLELAVSLRGVRARIHPVTFVLLIVLTTVPAFGRHPSTTYHLWNDPATRAYSRNGLPCSTAPVSGSLASKPVDPLRELDQIERQGVIALKKASERGNGGKASLYHPAVIQGSEKQPTTIDFVYYVTVAGGASASSRHH